MAKDDVNLRPDETISGSARNEAFMQQILQMWTDQKHGNTSIKPIPTREHSLKGPSQQMMCAEIIGTDYKQKGVVDTCAAVINIDAHGKKSHYQQSPVNTCAEVIKVPVDERALVFTDAQQG